MSGEQDQYAFGAPGWNHGSGSQDNYSNSYSTLSYHEQAKLKDFSSKIRGQFDFLEADEVEQAVLDNNFDVDKINTHFAKFAIDEKYQGLEAYEWKQVDKKEFVNKKRRGGRGGRGNNYRGRGNYNTQYNGI
mmetsp:Transcript_15539/g.17272  ORF Transcript_15539/g.17272 Transcript_15539/m.17272 type:complete len:132 (+) Transcript_15539:42-437(+)